MHDLQRTFTTILGLLNVQDWSNSLGRGVLLRLLLLLLIRTRQEENRVSGKPSFSQLL